MINVFNNEKKKRMTEKILDLAREMTMGDGGHGCRAEGFILNYSNRCNFKCAHCYTRSGSGEFGTTTLTIEDVKRLADEADALGVYHIDIQGGEPLLLENLFEILEALGTHRFYVYITTNGWFLDEEMAFRLAAAGVDRISVSIDAFSAEEHDAFRGMPGAFERALAALENARTAGMQPYVNMVLGHYNAQSEALRNFLLFLKEKRYGVVFNCAAPTGNWRGNYDAMLTPEDTRHIEQLRKVHKSIIRDLWNYFGGDGICGCPAVNLFYVNPVGDVLPCPYIHTKLGNIRERSLKDILDAGFRVKYFRDRSTKCLVGEDRDFATKFLDRDMTVLNPMPLDRFFAPGDFIAQE